jgi:RHS repeat-associated protein
MAGISSKAAGKLENRHKFNDGTEFNTELGLDWYETTFRGYDPQIGRFHQIDALADANPSWSTYSFVQNNPIAFIDPLGLDTFNVKNIPDGREFNTSDVLVNDAVTMVGYWNGESWAQMFSELDDVAVVGSQKSSGGGSSSGVWNFINSAGFVGFSSGYSIGTSSWDIYKYRFANSNTDVLALRNNTFLATANNGATKAFKMSFVGNQHYSSYRVNVMKWAFLESKSLAKLRFLEKSGIKLNVLGTLMVGADLSVNGLNLRNGMDLGFNGIGYLGPYGMAISAAYNVVKIGLPSDSAELRKLGEGSLNGQIVHPYQVMGGLSPGFQISPSLLK